MKPKLIGWALVLCWELGVTHALGQITYSITDLGIPPGATSTGAYGINSGGEVVGAINMTNGYPHAFRYSGGVMADLGTLGGNASVADGINGSGQICGYAQIAGSPFPPYHAFLYSNGVMKDLGTLGGDHSAASAINDRGQVTGNAATATLFVNHAFLYSDGAMSDLGALRSGTGSYGVGLNSRGEVVGGANLTNDLTDHAFLYAGGAVVDLGMLAGISTDAASINDSGQIVGYNSTNGGSRAFLYAGGVMTELGTLGGNSSSARSINNSGQVVGYSETASGATHAFVYRQGPMRDLNDLIDTNSGWALGSARAINDSGQIAGSGVNPSGQNAAFLLTPFRDLFLSRLEDSLVLSWFTNAPVALSLFQCSNLASGNWLAVTNAAVVTNAQYWVLLSLPANGSQFFRLQSP